MLEKLKNFCKKFYYIIILGISLGYLIIINTNNINKLKSKINNIVKKDVHLARNNPKRILDYLPNNETRLTNEVCSIASKKLNYYLETSDLSNIDIDEGLEKIQDGEKDYIHALTHIIQNNIYQIVNYENENEYENSDNSDIIKYLKHILPFVIFFFISFICIIGWLSCCICTCCNCCCCCCCKKVKCITPCLIFNFIFYIIIISICIYGLAKSKTIFTGVADAHCSFLKLFNNIINGEAKETKPKWIGTEKIINNLLDLKNNFENEKIYKHLDSFDSYFDAIEKAKYSFNSKLKDSCKKFYKEDGINLLEGYFIEYPNYNYYFIEKINEGEIFESTFYLKNKYVLDFIYNFGKYHSENESFSGLISLWDEEISQINKEVTKAMVEIIQNFIIIKGFNYYNIIYQLNEANNELNDLFEPLNLIFKNKSKTLNKFSKILVKVNLISTIFFSVLILMIILLAFLFIFVKLGYELTCCKKALIIIIINILSILMILSFLLGSIIALIGKIGGDFASAFSYIISYDNFNNYENPILIDIFGSGKKIIEEILIGEGNLSKSFNLYEYKENFDSIIKNKKEIEKNLESLTNLKNNYPAYNFLKSILKNKTEFINDTELYYYNSDNLFSSDIIDKINLDEVLYLLNNSIGGFNDERWDISNGDKNFMCFIGQNEFITSYKNLLHPWACEPIDRYWIQYSNFYVKNYAKISSDIIDLLKFADGTKNPGVYGFQNYYSILDELKYEYNDYLNKLIYSLENFLSSITNIIFPLENEFGIGNDSFGFLDGKIIKINYKILLTYLKNSLGKDFYILGLFFIIIGFSLCLITSFSILLMIIIDLTQKKKIIENNFNLNNLYLNPNNIYNDNNYNHNNNQNNKETYSHLSTYHNNNQVTESKSENKKIKKNTNVMQINKKNKNSVINNLSNNKNITNGNQLENKSTINFHKINFSNTNENMYDAESIKKKVISLKKEIKIHKLKINLIFLYEAMTIENVNLYNKLKLEVLGAFFGVKDIEICKKLLFKINKSNSLFILISTGSSFQKINNLCSNLVCIKDIMIFCMNVDKYKQIYSSNNKVHLITNSELEINNYLNQKSYDFEDYNKNKKKDLIKLINHTPLISLYEYENYYYIFHKMLSFFFKEDFSYLKFGDDYMKKVFNFIDKNSELNDKEQNELKDIIKKLKNSNNFLKDSLIFYTSENKFIYLFNRTMRKIEQGVTRLSFLIGPIYYSIVRFLRINNNNYILKNNTTLYRNIVINEYELNTYYMSQGNIICFPSFTSTSFKKNEFTTTNLAKKVNNIGDKEINLLIILHYYHKYDLYPHGMILKNLSVNMHEDEVLLFPFTFVKVNFIKKIDDTFYELDCLIINKDNILEFGLKNGRKVVLKNNILTNE